MDRKLEDKLIADEVERFLDRIEKTGSMKLTREIRATMHTHMRKCPIMIQVIEDSK